MIRPQTVLVALTLAAGPTFAQTTPPGPPTAPPPGSSPTVPERVEPSPGSGIPRSGVITPPTTRPMPQADVPAERPNSTPVIPPPGTPGGAPSPQPR